MDIKLLIIFVILNVVNVIIQTVKSIATIKCGKTVAALVNAVAYGLYTVVVVYTVCDLPLWFKVIVVGLANLIGVYVVKFFEEKAKKDKLWKVEATVRPNQARAIKDYCDTKNIPYSYIDIEKYVIFNLYCATQKESAFVKEILNKHNAKYFVSETKTL